MNQTGTSFKLRTGIVVRPSRPHIFLTSPNVQARSGFAFGYAVTGCLHHKTP